jgi:hypothetical protein
MDWQNNVIIVKDHVLLLLNLINYTLLIFALIIVVSKDSSFLIRFEVCAFIVYTL